MRICHLIPAAALLVLALTGCGVANASTSGLRAPAGPAGWVIDQQPGSITVAPFDREASAVIIGVTPAQAAACTRLDVYPACVG